MNNPYTGLLNIMQEQGKKYNTPAICIGKVMRAQPLQIKTSELLLDQDDLLISDILSSAYKRSVEMVSSGKLTSSTQATSGGTGDASFATHNHKISESYNLSGTGDIVFKADLKSGDLLALMPTEKTYNALIQLPIELYRKYKLEPERAIIRHYDVTGKVCPKYYVEDGGAFKKLKEEVRGRMTEDKELMEAVKVL